MAQRIKKVVNFDGTATSINEVPLSIPLPEGFAIEVVSASFILGIDTVGGSSNKELNCAIMAKPSGLSTLKVSDLEVSPEAIASGTLVEYILSNGSMAFNGAGFLDIGPKAYSLAPYVSVGSDAVLVGSSVFNVMFIVDYDLVKVTTAVATSLAIR